MQVTEYRARRLLAVLLLVLLPGPSYAANRPNIILFITDDQSPFSWDYPHYSTAAPFGFNGAEAVHTPEIDRIANEGIVFTRSYVSSSVCSPSRYTALTGRYAGRSRGKAFMLKFPEGTPTRVENNTELEYDRLNLARVLQANGYRTGFVGKSHIVDQEATRNPDMWGSKYDLEPYDQEDDPENPEITRRMKHNHNWWKKRIAEYGFDYVNGVYSANLRELYNSASDVHNVEWTTRSALEFIRSSGDAPFFLYYASTVPHGPDPWREGVPPLFSPNLDGAVGNFINDLAARLYRLLRRVNLWVEGDTSWPSRIGLRQYWSRLFTVLGQHPVPNVHPYRLLPHQPSR